MPDLSKEGGRLEKAPVVPEAPAPSTEPAAASPNRARQERMRAKNRRTALFVGALALFFFVALFVKRLWIH